MKQITIEDCWELKRKFDAYTETAEQYEFPMLLLVDSRLTKQSYDFELNL